VEEEMEADEESDELEESDESDPQPLPPMLRTLTEWKNPLDGLLAAVDDFSLLLGLRVGSEEANAPVCLRPLSSVAAAVNVGSIACSSSLSRPDGCLVHAK
jgi:hypothetical protein